MEKNLLKYDKKLNQVIWFVPLVNSYAQFRIFIFLFSYVYIVEWEFVKIFWHNIQRNKKVVEFWLRQKSGKSLRGWNWKKGKEKCENSYSDIKIHSRPQ